MSERKELFQQFVAVVERLRAPGGCPWDREQTHQTLRPYVVEEAYEVVEAIDDGRAARLADELGDLLLQVVLHSVIAAEAEAFTIDDVIRGITAKIVRRHPHVFASEQADTPAQVKAHWEEIKRREREAAGKGQDESVLAGIPRGLPALLEAQKLQGRAASVGFDWPDAREAWAKVEEELMEFSQAWREEDREALEEELGDLFFALVNVSRLLDISPEMSLKAANIKFKRRFLAMETLAHQQGKGLRGFTLAAMDQLWDQVKSQEKKH